MKPLLNECLDLDTGVYMYPLRRINCYAKRKIMKLSYISLVLFFHSACTWSEVFYDPIKIESEASHYRMLAIECITDIKITRKEAVEIESCKSFSDFVKSKYPNLKASLENAQQQVKVTANAEGLTSKNVKEILILLMSARSHMQIAGEIATKI